MKTYKFHEGKLPSDIPADYETAIFNLPAFQSLQESKQVISFYILNTTQKKAAAGIHFHLENGLAQSLFRAPFGSVEFSGQLVPGILYEFLEYVESQLKKRGISDVFIKSPPQGYEPLRSSLPETFFLNQKYVISEAEVSTLIRVTDEPFADIMRHSERLRMQRAQKADFIFKKLSIDHLDEVYLFLSQCHADKGYKPSMTLQELKRTANEFPEQYLLFVILQGKKLVAATVSIRIKKNILYNFFANHEREYDQFSPLVLLINGLYGYCRENNITLLDLGTSSLDGKPNFKLLDFKMHIGGIPSSKFTFYKKIS